MVDPRHRKAPTLDVPAEFSGGSSPWRKGAIAVAAVILVAGVWWIWSSVKQGNASERWRDLAAIEGLGGDNDDATRAWLDVPAPMVSVHVRDEEIAKIEAFLAKQGDSAEVAAHGHAVAANVEMTQILGLAPTTGFDALKRRYESADAHLEKIEKTYVDAPMNWERFRPKEEASITKLLRKTLKANRAWDEAHGMKESQPDPDVVVLLRTTRGDLRLRLFSKQSPALSKAFVDRVCAGGYTGTSFFAKREEVDETWVRGGDARTKKADKEPTDDDRLKWGDASPGEPLLADEGRNLVLHSKGIVSAWHTAGEEEDDPVQFLIVAKDSEKLNYEYTPFARVEEASLATLDHILASPSRRQQRPDILSDPAFSALADQLAIPATIVKALVYDKGALRKDCAGGADADASEANLDGVKPDAYVKADPPKTPPTPPPAPAGATPPAAPTVPGMDVPPPAAPAAPMDK